MPTTPRTVLVVGAGIAGCSAAIALAQRGARVSLIEQQPEWRFQSSGIFVYANGLECFGRLGVLPEILDAGFAIPDGRNIYLDATGAPIGYTFYPPGHTPEGEVPAILGIKRAEMHRVLAHRLQGQGITIHLDTTVARLQPGDAHTPAQVTLSNGTTATFDLVVAADGIRSQLREMLFGMREETTPRYSGLGVWRSVHARPAALADKIMLMAPGKRLGIMPISHDRLYLFGTVADPAKAWHPRAQWPQLMRESFAEFGGPVRQFLDELGPDSEVLYTAVEEVALPLPWHVGRTLLIGDAAHASTPFMGQGGAMAVEDGVVLADCLARMEAEGGGVEAMLRGFSELRYPMCRFVQDASRRVGEAGAREGVEDFGERVKAMRETAQGQVDAFYGRLYGMRSFRTDAL